MKSIAVFLIRAYQAITAFLRGVGVPLGDCRFSPTCSEYMIQSIEKYGIAKGIVTGSRRISRCHPFSPGGVDPVR